jgi:phenylpropionate dioxygenase-like ring-hydroxylating dioxygenase large terminal subunit
MSAKDSTSGPQGGAPDRIQGGNGPWRPAAAEGDVGTAPLAVVVDGVPLVLLRTQPHGPPAAFADRCPHRLVPLSAGSVEGGRLRCVYHGWEFTAEGRCAVLPSAGPDAAAPPKADLPAGPRLRVESGVVWVHADDLSRIPAEPSELLTNESPQLRRAWHPVALATEVTAEPVEVTLLGQRWSLRRLGNDVIAEPPPYGLQQRWGLVWLAPREPLVELFTEPDEEDAAYVGAWLAPVRTPAPAGVAADNFLDVAHFPFVHAATFGAEEEKVVAPYEVSTDPLGCRSVQDQWFDNPEDPGVAAGIRPLRQRRQATYVYRAPFQLMLRLAELDADAVKTILFFVQPETLASTRIYTKLLLHGIGGVSDPGPDLVARELAFEEMVLAEDLALQRSWRLAGLPLRMRDEMHVRADLLGVTLRRTLVDFVAQAGAA